MDSQHIPVDSKPDQDHHQQHNCTQEIERSVVNYNPLPTIATFQRNVPIPVVSTYSVDAVFLGSLAWVAVF